MKHEPKQPFTPIPEIDAMKYSSYLGLANDMIVDKLPVPCNVKAGNTTVNVTLENHEGIMLGLMLAGVIWMERKDA